MREWVLLMRGATFPAFLANPAIGSKTRSRLLSLARRAFKPPAVPARRASAGPRNAARNMGRSDSYPGSAGYLSAARPSRRSSGDTSVTEASGSDSIAQRQAISRDRHVAMAAPERYVRSWR